VWFCWRFLCQVHSAVAHLVKCYQWKYSGATIFTVKNPLAVYWGHYSVLQADLKCMQLLRSKNVQWRILVNPAATELPLKPISNIRKYLKTFPNGIIDSFSVPKGNKYRFNLSVELQQAGSSFFDRRITVTDKVKNLPPANITIRKGSKNVALPRELVDFILDSQFSHGLLKWLEDSLVPDEHFYSTIMTILKNGTQDLNTDFTHGGCVRLSWWGRGNCSGKNIRGVCNFGLGDLSELHKNRNCLFANKFNLQVDPLA
ncbi:hypothetical protein TCAL_09529, partial [Tigriopus californicus]